MITQYYRPQTLEEALRMLSNPDTLPLGGGTILTQFSHKSFSVVDLQSLGLDKILKSGDRLAIGAAVTLQTLLESSYIPEALKSALLLETPFNLRTMGTVAGTLVSCDGRSPFATVMLGLDAKMTFAASVEKVTLGNFLPMRVGADGIPPVASIRPNRLITEIEIPLKVKLSFETVARSPADKPIVCVALAQWSSGRTRLALGGFGAMPALALDGNAPNDLEAAARNAFAEAGDAWASKEYRSEIAAVLAKRCLDAIS
jgi:CO/xanthine dehydrogenase FAD-binding subunit